MLIKRTPDVYEKIKILGGMAGDDILSPVPSVVPVAAGPLGARASGSARA